MLLKIQSLKKRLWRKTRYAGVPLSLWSVCPINYDAMVLVWYFGEYFVLKYSTDLVPIDILNLVDCFVCFFERKKVYVYTSCHWLYTSRRRFTRSILWMVVKMPHRPSLQCSGEEINCIEGTNSISFVSEDWRYCFQMMLSYLHLHMILSNLLVCVLISVRIISTTACLVVASKAIYCYYYR